MKLNPTIRYRGFDDTEECPEDFHRRLMTAVGKILFDSRGCPEGTPPADWVIENRKYLVFNHHLCRSNPYSRQIKEEGLTFEEIQEVNALLDGILGRLDRQITMHGESNKAIADDYRRDLEPWFEFSAIVRRCTFADFSPRPTTTIAKGEKYGARSM